MSWAAARWARELREAPTGAPLSGPVAHLLLLLSSYHSEVGPSQWPKVPEMAAALRMSDRRVQQHLDWMESNLLIRRNTRGGRGHATEYTLLLPERVKSAEGSERKGCNPDCTLSAETEKGCNPEFILPNEEGCNLDCTLSPDAIEKGEIPEPEWVKSGGEKGEITTNGGGTIGGSTRGTSSPSKTRKRLVTPDLSPQEKGERALADAEFMALLREEYPTVRIERQARRWLEHLAETDRPPRGNYKNAFRNWLDKSIAWGHEPGPETVSNGSTTGPPQPRQRAPTNGAIGAARAQSREPAAPDSGLGRFGRRAE